MPRPKGSKNKVTNDVRGVLNAILERNVSRIEIELQALHGKAYLDGIFKIAEFCISKPKEEITQIEVPKLQITLNGINKKTK